MGRLGIELSALSAQELRRLLEVARARGQTTLVQQLTAELDGRTAAWRPPSIAAARPPTPSRQRSAPQASAARTPIAAALVGLATAALAWGLTVPLAPERGREMRAASPPPVRLAVALAPEAMPEFTVREADALAEAAVSTAAEEPAPAAARASRNPCFDLPTAAERLICGFPALAERHHRMLDAYRAARASGVDLQALDSAQAVWRAESADIADRHELSDMYEERIRELQAVTARPDSGSF